MPTESAPTVDSQPSRPVADVDAAFDSWFFSNVLNGDLQFAVSSTAREAFRAGWVARENVES